jgi:hypothetical protein
MKITMALTFEIQTETSSASPAKRRAQRNRQSRQFYFTAVGRLGAEMTPTFHQSLGASLHEPQVSWRLV